MSPKDCFDRFNELRRLDNPTAEDVREAERRAARAHWVFDDKDIGWFTGGLYIMIAKAFAPSAGWPAAALCDKLEGSDQAIRKARQQGRDEAMLAMMGLLSRLPHAGGQALAVEIQSAMRGLAKL